MDLLYAVLITPIEKILHLVLSIGYAATGHYGASLLILSLCVNLALLPIYHLAGKWQQAERDMQRLLRPRLQELRETFSGEERFMMIRTLYRQAGYHPIYAVRSSMGFLIQVPFFIAAYHLLSHYPELEGVPAFIFEDLSKPDGLLWGMNVMPFVMTAVNLLSVYVYAQKRRRSDIVQLWGIALLFLVLLYNSAAALLLYWTINNVFSLLKNMAYARLTSNSTTGAGPIAGIQGKFAQFMEIPTRFSFGLFLVVVAIQAALVTSISSSEGGRLDNSRWLTILAIGTSIAILAYLCVAFTWKVYQGARVGDREVDFRVEINIVLAWLLFAAFVVVHSGFLLKLYPSMRSTRIGGILLTLSFLLFALPFCGSIRILRTMPDSHFLYGACVSLLAFTVLVANPISFFVHSGDFSSGVYGVVGTQLVYFVLVLLAFASLYVLAGNSVRKVLTLLAVFSALSAIAYSAIGVKNAGLMIHFRLQHWQLLIRSQMEMVEEVGILLVLFGVTTYLTIHYRQRVTQVTSTMLLVSLGAAAADVYTYKGDGNAGEVHRRLPIRHHDVVGFSREQNVLFILLDGFPGGYIQKIMKESPNALKDYEGFKWYANTLSISAATMSSIPSLVGGHKYTPQNVNNGEYGSIGRAMKESYAVYPGGFIPKGYQVTYLPDPTYNNGCEGIDRRVLCTDTVPYGIYYHDNEEPDVPLWDDADSYSDIPPILSVVSAFKASPFLLKYWIYSRGMAHALPATVHSRRANSYKIKDWGFLRVLAREGNVDSEFKTFKFIHLQIPHGPHALSDDCRLLPSRATVFTESVCALKEIGVLLSWLKENGIYDSTKIVVASDHGWKVDNPMFPPDFSQTVPKGHRSLTVPGIVQSLLLVKDFGAKGNMSRSDVFLSNSDVPSIIFATIGGYGDIDPDPTANNPGDRRRTFTIVAQNNPEDERASKFNILEAYEVNNNIFDPRNWTRIK